MTRALLPILSLICLWALGANTALGGSLLREVESLPDVPAPPAGTTIWIAKAMRLNGVPMTMKAFASPANAEEVLHHYERQLHSASDTRTRRSHEGKRQVLAVLAQDYYITVRAQNSVKGSEGTIVVTPVLAHVLPDKRTMFPLPRTMQIVSLQEYDDEGIEAEHISLISRRSPGIEARAIATELAQRGWQLLRSESMSHRHRGYVIEAQKAAALAQISLQHDNESGHTRIMIVWRKA